MSAVDNVCIQYGMGMGMGMGTRRRTRGGGGGGATRGGDEGVQSDMLMPPRSQRRRVRSSSSASGKQQQQFATTGGDAPDLVATGPLLGFLDSPPPNVAPGVWGACPPLSLSAMRRADLGLRQEAATLASTTAALAASPAPPIHTPSLRPLGDNAPPPPHRLVLRSGMDTATRLLHVVVPGESELRASERARHELRAMTPHAIKKALVTQHLLQFGAAADDEQLRTMHQASCAVGCIRNTNVAARWHNATAPRICTLEEAKKSQS